MEQPKIRVGIMTADKIEIIQNPEKSSFTIKDVPIGINFHWERKEDQEFKGEIEIIEKEGQKIAINIIPLEDYLESVISSEMAATSSLELLKAHAVISRSWLMAQIEKLKKIREENYSSIIETDEEYIRWYDREDHTDFDVCADDHCQRYQGITKITSPKVSRAIRETYGEFLIYNDSICDARFSKCCGGRTEKFENTWEPVSYPYLISVPDIQPDGTCFCDTKDRKILTQVLNDYDRETHSFYRWEVAYTQQELSELILKKTGWDFGKIVDLIPVETGESGRIIRLKIVGTKMVKAIGKELFIRKALSETHLYSSAFFVEKIYGQEVDMPETFILKGKGWGHGVGLCQIGAAVMAAEGYSYKEILSHYFPETGLKKLYERE